MEEELDEMVLALWAIEAYQGYSPAQQERMTRYVRGLTAYEATRPAARRPSNVIDLETHIIRRKIEPVVRAARKSALAEGLRVHQAYAYDVNEFGDIEYPDIE
ncbi:hypothetical protein J2Y63_004187 [Shinella sp. BE166]|uniref:hypothetical protein n=1 Tax=Shinella sp. BE166 TaxID=3373918 RepID=UPI003EB6A6E0